MLKKAIFTAAISGLLAISAAYAQTPAEQTFLTTYGLDGKTASEMIDYIDQLPQQRPLPYNASVTSTELKLSDGKNVYTYPLENDFYLSIAPYITYTHDCFNHSLSGCKAELVNTPYQVTVKDDTGNIIFDETVTSFANGFYGLWLPRNISGTVEVNYDGRQGSSVFSTGEKSQTCMTTIQLK